MALTIQFTPALYSSLQDDLVYTVADAAKVSDPVTYPNFKFIGDVYIGASLVARLRKIPDPATGIGVFNIAQIVRNYLETKFNPTAGALVAQQLQDGSFHLAVTVAFGEEWNYTPTYNIVTDSARIYFNNYNRRLIGVTSSLSAFTNKVASNRPTSGQAFLTSAYLFIPYFPITTSAVSIVVTPSGGGTPYSSTFTPSNSFDMQVLNVAPAALNAIAAGTITNNTKSYTVNINGQVYTITLICEPMFQSYTVHFLNQYGGFESKIFSKVSRKTYEATKKDFGKLPYTVDSSGIVSRKNANGVYNESKSVYASQFIEKLQLNSDLLTDADYTWLADLVLSPMVYIEDGSYLFPCAITDTSYEPKKFINDDLTNLTINIEYGLNLNAQFR